MATSGNMDNQRQALTVATVALPEQVRPAANGRQTSQITERTGMPLGTVKTHLRRGLIAVRERLAERGA